jgi:gentisate 1,2-dioxygenase
METVTFQNRAAQGDLMLRRIEKLPTNAKPLASENGVFVVAHSETGHNHVIDHKPNVQWYGTDDPMVSYLQVIEATDETETLLRHLRGHDTHKTIVIPVGVFEVRRQREHTPEGWRRVED